MQTISYSEARENLKSVIDKVIGDRAPIAITRQRGEGAVLVSQSDWASIEENALSVALTGERSAPSRSGARTGSGWRRRARTDRIVKIVFWATAWEDYLHWQVEDAKLFARVNTLLKECRRDPFRGTGKPEPLGGNLTGWWSRRINHEHRLIYRMTGKGEAQALEVAQCRYH